MSEQCISQNKIFDGKILSTRVDKVKLPNGREATREIVEHKPAVGMLALTNHKSVLLVKQYRYAVDEDTLEICAGLIEPGEEPKDAASREMQEEMGYKPGKLIKI
ncbi:MAG: NUDIX hydrolase, partial [Synergistaceae bacterium]|nr:NUDIX hydrolase [Synergistaceae bacterium]